jgi:hypothetical protein
MNTAKNLAFKLRRLKSVGHWCVDRRNYVGYYSETQSYNMGQ